MIRTNVDLLIACRVPPNCVFEIDDIEKPWVWKQPFDYIHSANIGQGIRDWKTYLKRAYDNLTPGGVLECFESRLRFESDDDSIPKNGALEKWVSALGESTRLAGFEDIPPKLEGYIKEAGFVDVKLVIKEMPLNPWPKDPKKKVSTVLPL